MLLGLYMKRLAKLAICVATVFSLSKAYAIPELLVWDDDRKSSGIAQAIAEFETTYDCKVTVEELPFTSHVDRVRLDGPSGIGPDIFLIPSDKLGAAVVHGLISPIKFMLEDSDKYINSAVSAFVQNGEIYAVPKVVETLVLIYNKSLMKTPLDTLDEYYDYSKKQVASNSGKYGLLAKWDALYYAFTVLSPYGAYVFGKDSDGNLDASDVGLDNEGAIEGIELIKRFYDSGCFPQQILLDEGLEVMDNLFLSGKVAAVVNGPWALDVYSRSKIDVGVAPLPILPNGKPMSSFLGVKGYAISTWARHHDLAEKFLRFINQPQFAKQRFKITKEIPPVKAVMVDPVITENEVANAIAVQASRAVPMPSIPEMAEVWDPYDSAIKSAFNGKISVRDALKAAVENINLRIEAFRSGQ